jgi:Lrp/AsnC family leucine-responsive transcriptional regulator
MLYQPDETDKRILKLLQADGRLSAKEIADKIGLTVTPTYERIRKIEKSGILKSVVALLDREQLGLKSIVYCNVSLQVHALRVLQQFERAVKKMPEVMECYHITGNFDYLLKVAVKDMNAYQQFLTQKLAALDNIAQVHSNFVMTDVKHSTAFEIG